MSTSTQKQAKPAAGVEPIAYRVPGGTAHAMGIERYQDAASFGGDKKKLHEAAEKFGWKPLFAAPVSAEQAALAADFGQAETRVNTGHARQNVDHFGQDDGSEVSAPVSAEPVAWMTHHDEPMLFPTQKEAHLYCDDYDLPIPLYAAPVAAQPAPEGWKLVPETIPLAGLDAAIAWMRPAMNEAGRDLAYCLRGVWEILLKSVKTPVAVQAQPLPDSLIPAAPDLEYLRSMAENGALPAFLRGQIAAAMKKLAATQAQQDADVVSCGCGDLYPSNSYGAGFIAAAGHCENCDAAQDTDAAKVDAEPDMFWDDDDPERCQDSIHNVLVEVQCNHGLSVGNVVEVQRAIRLPNVSVRITAVEDEDGGGDLEYEVIDAARKEPAP
ncbi:hypothetical protein [Alcaligenes sp. WGS1538]|uniref:hypothetical protein n=1 Tax=Alcaligenes sp. WGS1538 TaxID=3366811 RepID=UPI00372D1244